MSEFLFVGERRSQQAIERGYRWEQGVSTAKVLFDSLRDIGIDPEEQEFMNLWNDNNELQEIPEGKNVVGMGQVVQKKLEELGVEYTPIVHPAARGEWRRRPKYVNHLRSRLKDGENND